jgi:TonB family protein
LIFLLFVVSFEDLKLPPPQSSTKKISLNLKEFVPPAPKTKPVPKPVAPKKIEKPVVEPIKEKPKVAVNKAKRVVEKPHRVTAVKSEENNMTKEPKKEPVKVVKKEKPKKIRKEAKPHPQRRPVRSRDPLANALMGSVSSKAPKHVDRFTKKVVNQLYGKEFYSYTKAQQQFIKNNLGEIHRITQNTLWQNGYPDVALRMRMQGTNIVSFYLHPNGDISDLRLKSSIGYRALDENTIEVIKTAYKDYPRPSKKTKIMFYVTYKIYGI